MAQFDILNALKKAKKPLTLKEIMETVDISHSNVGVGLRKLKKKGHIKKSELLNKNGRTYAIWSLNGQN